MVVRVLFVDDAWDELEQLRRLTRHLRPDWDMSFACGSNDALRHLAQATEPPDVVLTELELAGMDGIDLLRAIQGSAPRSLRLLHSDRPSTAAIVRAIPWTHRFLPKPLDPHEFERTVAELRGDPTAHESHAIAEIAGAVVNLPVLPSTYQQVVEISSRDDYALQEIAAAIQGDVALTTETMKLVNSSFFGLRTDVTSIEQAVNLLGLDVVRGLVLASSLFDQESASWLDLRKLAERSQAVASLARALARVDGLPVRDQALAFLGGMVHGAGLLLLARCERVELPPSTGIENSIDPNIDMRLFGMDRYALGAYLLRLWGFEPGIVEAVAGLALHPRVVDSATARTLRTANELVAWGGFSVAAFVANEPETVTIVEAMRAELDKRLDGGDAPNAA